MSFEVQDCATTSISLQTAILFYGNGNNISGVSYATIHPVDGGDGQASPVIRAGRPLDRASLEAACASLMEGARVRCGIFSDNILSIGLEHLVWWQRPGKRTYFFACRPAAEGEISVGQRAGTGFTPGVVFVAKRQSLWAYAVKGEARPTADTRLYHLPAMNVWPDGRVCTGSAPLPDSTVAESVAAWEKSFWDSNFSHPNHPRPVNYKGGIHQFSIDLLDGKFRKFPQRVLRPIKGLTLGCLVDRLDGITRA
jgi:PRTRC genetic system protein B